MIRKILLVIFLFSVLLPRGMAQNTKDSVLRGESLSEVIVTARHGRDIVPVQSLSGKQLQSLSSNSIADALRYFAGVQIKDYGGIGGLKTINIRSMGSQHVGVFYDGIQISNVQNGTVDLGKFSMDNMEVLAVYNGQKSSIFQSAKDFASAGALYMVSRRPVFGNGRNILNFRVRTGSFDLANVSALWDYKVNDRVGSTVNVEFLNTSGKYKYRYQKAGGYDTTETRGNGDVLFVRAEAALFGKTASTDWMVKGYFYHSGRGYPGAAVKKDYGISLLNEDRQKDRNLFLQGSLTKTFSHFYSLMFKAKYAHDYMNYVMPQETTLEPMDNRYWQQEVYASLSNLFQITRDWSVNLAGDFQWNKLEADGSDVFNVNFVQPRRYTVLGAVATSLGFSRGLRVQGSVMFTYVHDTGNGKAATTPDKTVFTPTCIVAYRPWKPVPLDFRFFYKNIFRMPTFNDLYYVQIGNRSLKPEYTDQFDAGASYRKEFKSPFFTALEVSADVYYNKVKDKIIATPTSNQLVWTMVNLGSVDINGVDLTFSPSFQVGRVSVFSRFSYTYQRALDCTESKKEEDLGGEVLSMYKDQIPYVPVHSGSAILNGSYRTWDFHYSFIYTGERYMLGGNIPANYILPWYTSDISVSKKFRRKDAEFFIHAEVNNLFNQQYEVVKWYPMPGINFKITLSIRI